MASELAEKILGCISECGTVNTLDLASKWQEEHQKIVGAVKSLECLGEVIQTELLSSSQWELTEEGKEVVAKGSHEALVYNAVPAEGISQAQIMASVPNAKVGFSKAMVAGWIAVDKSGPNGPKVVRKVPSIKDEVQERLSQLQKGTPLPDNIRQEYKKRKLVQEITVKSYILKAGQQFTTTISKPETDLTPEMIANGSWKNKTFKSYNLEAKGLPPPAGHLHPLLKVRAEFRQIFLEMGFSEMPTNQFVESSFWNFDSLFQPQAHPARDAQDTFFLSEPAKTDLAKLPQDYVKKVASVHSIGGFGSKGYGREWSYDEAAKNVLRTHTTAVSARMLYKLAQEPKFRPVKYFSVDRVFRNETLDATHLAEFHQIEGVVADYGLTLGDLIGVIHAFFKKLGMTQLRFKPAYNPYTEPSMEIFSFHPGLNKWVEVGNSGLFRPEMLLPMGLPEGVVVIAWGLSLERPTMIKYGYDNIRDLVGPRVNLDMVANNPICRLDKHGGKDKQTEDETVKELAAKLDTICHRIQALCSDLYQLKAKLSVPVTNGYSCYVLVANPAKPPKVLQYLISQLARSLSLTLSTHWHSSVTQNGEVFHAPNLSHSPVTSAGRITWIWKSVAQPELHISSKVTTLVGEAGIIRFAARYLEHYGTENGQGRIVYESLGWLHSARVDAWMDKIEACTKIKQLISSVETSVSRDGFLLGSSPCIADLLLWSRISNQASSAAMQNWSRCIQALIGR